MSASIKKKKVSKKNKSAWRKHVNIRDVEDYLDDRRLEERLGVFTHLTNDELFVVDTQPENTFVTKESRKQKKRLELAKKGPRCYEILTPHTKVPDPSGERNHVRPVGSQPADLSRLSVNRKTQKGIYKKRHEVASKNRASARADRSKRRQALSDFETNIWDVTAAGNNDALESEWVSKDAKLNTLVAVCGLRRGPTSAPSALIPTSKLPAVIPPHPGASYNPSYQDHQSLLQDVAEKEVKIIKQEQHLKRVTTKMFKKVNPKQRDAQWLNEMSVGIPKIEQEEDIEKTHNPDDSDSDYRALNPPVQNKKKTTAQRNKQKEHRAEMDQIRRAKQEKKRVAQIYRLRKIEAEINKSSAKFEKAKVVRDKKREEYEATGVHKLNAHRFEEPGEDFFMASELTGSLRTLKSEGNLLRERYLSMQRRNILPPSRLFIRKKTKGKKYVKRDHKIPEDKVRGIKIKNNT